ncbi:helicase C-terminal domain-containing protein [Methanobrevibacter sp.]|uniref:helicase C-terminal domain-containing protein n=1 Tax=Methanobrevibacter sp. TaxID=66852 RepID=UPI0025FFCFF7|nr:helicase C-terminal domain-containing protein [Methanobrevibacter sp.]MBQ2830942.1 DEAD/DEAH box helicase family protein [Methanobrevibacter sp.]
MVNTNSNLDWMVYWSLPKYSPRNSQIKLINQINFAIGEGFKNIILEAGTGIGKSAIATTLANMYDDSYILTMTKQLQEQYLDDFGDMLVEIKGRGNYKCNYKGSCDFCIKAEYNLRRCSDCEYQIAFRKATEAKNVITNYDFLYYAGVANPLLDSRELLILDEAHNLERKMLMLSSSELNREYISTKFGIDIFEPLMHATKSMNDLKRNSSYWIQLCDDLVKECKKRIKKIEGDANKSVQVTLDEFESDPSKYSNFDYVEKQNLEQDMKSFASISLGLSSEDLIIDLPNRDAILSGEMDISAEFKPFSVLDDTQNLLELGNIRIFLTGTLGSKDKFCEWNNINPDETFYIYEKSPFDVAKRPIYTDFVGRMSGKTRGIPNWKNKRAIKKIKELLDKHQDEKGVIHTSSNEQAFWIIQNLKDYPLVFVGGEDRNIVLKEFTESNESIVLIGASIKDGVDFKGDLCRFQIVFKIPYPQLNEQVKYRRNLDPKWFYYQTVMALMQAYGRGIRDVDDWCVMYIIDSSFKQLFDYNRGFFNEYFIEAVQKKK